MLDQGVDWIRSLMDKGLDREQMIEEFTALMRGRAIEMGIGGDDALAYELANPRSMSVDGIARYCQKHPP